MRKPVPSDCEDEHGHINGECYAEAMDRYDDERRDDLIQTEMDKKEEDANNKTITIQNAKHEVQKGRIQ